MTTDKTSSKVNKTSKAKTSKKTSTSKTNRISSKSSNKQISGADLMNLSYDEAKANLKDLVKSKSLFDYDAILPSGRITSHSVEMKESLLSAEGIFMASVAILHLLQDDVKFIGGAVESTYSLAATVSQLAMLRGQSLNTFLVRAETDAKRRGYSKWIDGPLKPGSKVCIIHDEAVDGSNIVKVIRKLQEEADSQIIQVISVLDRLDGAAVRLQNYGVDYSAILTMDDIVTAKR